jgi:hypothetical protein
MASDADAWRHARELGALPDELSPEVRRVLAWGVRTRDFMTMEARLRTFAAVDRRSLADAYCLRNFGGSFETYARLFDEPEALVEARRSLVAGRAPVAAVGAAVAFVVGVALTGSSSRSSNPRAPDGPAPRAGSERAMAEASEAVARLRGSIGNGPLDQQARGVGRALAERDCKAALAGAQSMRSGGPYAQMQSLVDAVVDAVSRACKVSALQ